MIKDHLIFYILLFFSNQGDILVRKLKEKHLSLLRKLVSGERGRRLIKRNWLVRNLLKFWESSIKQIFYWIRTYLISKKSFFTLLIIISMRSPRLESARPITVWSIWSILISYKSLRFSDATHFLIYVSNCCELGTRSKNKKCF